MKYTDSLYGFERLHRTFVFHKDQIYLVWDFDRALEKFILQSQDGEKIKVKGNKLDVTPFPLGYVNHSDTCCYTSRVPMRRDWKQGLRPNTLNKKGLPPYEDYFEVTNNSNLFILNDTASGKYPSYAKALEYVEESHRARAFSRYFSVHEDGSIGYKGSKYIGNVQDERSIKLKNQFIFLKEFLQENLLDQPVEVN